MEQRYGGAGRALREAVALVRLAWAGPDAAAELQTMQLKPPSHRPSRAITRPRSGRRAEHGAPSHPSAPPEWRHGLLRCLLAALFALFFQAYMVAPLIPFIAEQFGVSRQAIALMVPAYLLPYGIGSVTYGVLADRFGRRGILFFCLAVFAVCCGLTATAQSVTALILWRVATAVGSGGIALIALTLAGDLFPEQERGHALGWLFGAIAGGSACGSTLGGLLTPLIGWRGLFAGVALLSVLPLFALAPYWPRLATRRPARRESLAQVAHGYRLLVSTSRARNTFSYIFVNGLFHSGTFTWLGAYLADRFHLGEAGIGLALLGYGVPGFLFGPLLGKLVDRRGRGAILPWGLAAAALAVGALALPIPLWVAVGAITLLSLGFDMTHPLLVGIVTTLVPERRGQAIGLNGVILFAGFGLGSLLFGQILQTRGFFATLLLFGGVQAGLALGSLHVFRGERPAAG
jgi:predicted MFS family arabinose efflux permease